MMVQVRTHDRPKVSRKLAQARGGCQRSAAVKLDCGLHGANILALVRRQLSSAVGQASCLPVAAASSRELMFARLIIPETSGRMPEEPAGWKPALHSVDCGRAPDSGSLQWGRPRFLDVFDPIRPSSPFKSIIDVIVAKPFERGLRCRHDDSFRMVGRNSFFRAPARP